MRVGRQIRTLILCAAVGLSAAAETGVTTSPSAANHEVRLRPLFHSGSLAPGGAAIEVRLQGSSKPVRLLIDTGARDILLSAKTAEKIALPKPAREGRVLGFGGQTVSSRLLRTNVQVGDRLTLENVRIQIVDERPLQRDVDGLIGLNVFRDFIVELDVARNRLRLSREPGDDATNWIPWQQAGHLLMLRTDCNGRDLGMALLDTGSAYSAIDLSQASQVNGPAAARDFVSLRGVTGELRAGSYRLSPVQFEIQGSGDTLLDREPVAVNLRELGSRHGVRLSAVIGYPALARSVVQLDYRSGRLRLMPTR